MTTTDETAKALVNMPDDYDVFHRWMSDQITVGYKNYDLRLHLYLMARLWLMSPEITDAIHKVILRNTKTNRANLIEIGEELKDLKQ